MTRPWGFVVGLGGLGTRPYRLHGVDGQNGARPSRIARPIVIPAKAGISGCIGVLVRRGGFPTRPWVFVGGFGGMDTDGRWCVGMVAGFEWWGEPHQSSFVGRDLVVLYSCCVYL